MQRSSWQMLQSNLVWQAGHPLIQQIQSHINVTRKESAGRLLSRCDYHRGWGSAGRQRKWRGGWWSHYLGPEFFVESTGDEASFKENHYPLRGPILDFKVQVLLPVVQLGLLQGFDVEVWSLDLKWHKHSFLSMRKRTNFSNDPELRKAETYPFFKGPAFADFMFVVVEHFLSYLDHLVPHVLDLGHSLQKDTETEHGQGPQVCITMWHSHLMSNC